MSLPLPSPFGAPLRRLPFTGSGAFPLSVAAIAEERVFVSEGVEDGATRLCVEDVV